MANLITWATVYKTNYPYISTDVIDGITVDIKDDTDDDINDYISADTWLIKDYYITDDTNDNINDDIM